MRGKPISNWWASIYTSDAPLTGHSGFISESDDDDEVLIVDENESSQLVTTIIPNRTEAGLT